MIEYGDCAVACDVASNLEKYMDTESTRLVFMDPPFNTGKNFFDYSDKRTVGEWLDMMRPVLISVRNILRADGSVWINLDERMNHHCRLLCDEIFGADCYVMTVQWQKKYKASQSRSIHAVHNPIMIYGKNAGWRRVRGIAPNEAHVSKYKNPDNDPKGRYRFTHSGDRTYLAELLERGAMPTTWWTYQEVGYTELAVKEVIAECGVAFSTPKPLALMRRIINIGSDVNDWVVDPMAGSGTTIAAAIELRRRWFGIEREQATIGTFIKPRVTRRLRV